MTSSATPVTSSGITPERIMQVGLGFWASKVLLSAVELGVFTELAKAPADADTLAARLNLHPRSHRDFLDALVALGFLTRSDAVYSNSDDAAMFLDRDQPTYIGGMLEMANRRLYPFWGHLTAALRTGEPQNEIQHGEDLFAALYGDAERTRGFLQAMTGLSMGASRAIAEKFPWSRYRTFVDVGCAQGGLPVQLALAHSHLHGIGYDLEVVRGAFEHYVASFGFQDRLRFTSGDFFREPLPQADIVIMGHILHDWDLAQK